ncbi:MAG: transcription antitermination factor NusB [Bacteroidia bacterium]
MLSRRHLRVKVMQAIYAFLQGDNNDLAKGEKELLKGVNKIYDLYIYILLLLPELVDFGKARIDERKQKRIPNPEDLNPNTRFVDNPLLAKLSNNNALRREAEVRKLSWADEPELIKKIYNSIVDSEEYAAYMSNEDKSYAVEQKFVQSVFKKYVATEERLHSLFEDKSIYWVDDLEFINSMVVKTLGTIGENAGNDAPLLPLLKDDEDRRFMLDLFHKTIIHEKEYDDLIKPKLQNWEMERVAFMDVLLMKMAISEFLNFPSVPTKVSMNEYIEISKDYSTPQSKLFINGILDKILIDFKREDKIQKSGRGLME